MSKKLARTGILIFGSITAVIHAVILNLLGFDLLMLLNGLGYFVLVGAVYFRPALLDELHKLVVYALIVYTLITFVGFFVVNGVLGPLAIIAKVDEILLLISLVLYLRAE
jgi:hypothetical protein